MTDNISDSAWIEVLENSLPKLRLGVRSVGSGNNIHFVVSKGNSGGKQGPFLLEFEPKEDGVSIVKISSRKTEDMSPHSDRPSRRGFLYKSVVYIKSNDNVYYDILVKKGELECYAFSDGEEIEDTACENDIGPHIQRLAVRPPPVILGGG